MLFMLKTYFYLSLNILHSEANYTQGLQRVRHEWKVLVIHVEEVS